MDSNNRNKAKLLAAVIGGSAVVTMGALAMSTHQQPTGTQNIAVGRMTMAATTTASGKDDTVVATSTPTSPRTGWPCRSSRAPRPCRRRKRPPSSGRSADPRFIADPSGYPLTGGVEGDPNALFDQAVRAGWGG